MTLFYAQNLRYGKDEYYVVFFAFRRKIACSSLFTIFVEFKKFQLQLLSAHLSPRKWCIQFNCVSQHLYYQRSFSDNVSELPFLLIKIQVNLFSKTQAKLVLSLFILQFFISVSVFFQIRNKCNVFVRFIKTTRKNLTIKFRFSRTELP